jgi:exodeoxyribonuclease VII large subunit
MYHTLQMPSEQTDAISNSPYLTIEELSSAVKKTIEGRFEFVRVRGEVSQLRVPASGHVYFALKDEKNTLSSVIWRGSAARLSVQPEEGLDVICSGKMTTFGGQSRYQLIVNDVEIAGEGALLKQLEERRRKLADEGLFDAARKRPLPSFPKSIGVVTSPTGAVIRDILHRLSERFGVRVLVWGVNVQGAGSAEQIAAAIEGFNKLPETGEVARPDLLIVARGGGSIEDLWSFNEEIVVRAAAASVIPLISAVGHETDTTLIDYASDLRAPTPTAAAELATPVAADIKASLTDRQARLERAASRQIEAAQQSLRGLQRGLLHPRELIARHQQSVDIAASSVYNGLLRRLEGAASRFSSIAERLGSPSQRLAQVSERLLVCGNQLII